MPLGPQARHPPKAKRGPKSMVLHEGTLVCPSKTYTLQVVSAGNSMKLPFLGTSDDLGSGTGRK